MKKKKQDLMMMMVTTLNMGEDGGCCAGWQTRTGEGGKLHPGTFSENFQSTMKCTNVTGKAPLLSGSPSMCPSCKRGKQRHNRT